MPVAPDVGDAYWKLYEKPTPSADELKQFEEERTKLFNVKPTYDEMNTAATTAAVGGKNTCLCNFRLRLSTSSEMIADSGVELPVGALVGNGASVTMQQNERMGLRFGKDLAEYILGGWCIGRVMDVAASRAALPGQFVSNRDPTTYAMNIDVGVEWWSGDRLFRAYCDREGKTFTPRNGNASARSDPVLP